MCGTCCSWPALARRTALAEPKRCNKAAVNRGPRPGTKCKASRSRTSSDIGTVLPLGKGMSTCRARRSLLQLGHKGRVFGRRHSLEHPLVDTQQVAEQ